MSGRGARSERVVLGTITLPTGQLVVADMGYLDMWSGENEPAPPEVDDPALQARVDSAEDLRIVGPDAEPAARAFNRQSLTFLYDVPDPGGMVRLFDEVVGPMGFNALVEPEPRRVPHGERARRAIAAGGADFVINGVWVVAVGGLPAETPLRVVGLEVDYGQGVGRRWESVSVELTDAAAATTRDLGVVGVDWARLIFADPVCLDAWVHEEPLDGRADLVYWGADALECRSVFGGEALDEGALGWENLPVEEAADRGLSIETWRHEREKRLAVDFRPHSHHYRIMRAIRAHPREVGELDLAGGRVLALMTSWGDGIFPVEADCAADGSLLRVRVVLGDEDRRQRIQELAERA
jgi:hypothetical protein